MGINQSNKENNEQAITKKHTMNFNLSSKKTRILRWEKVIGFLFAFLILPPFIGLPLVIGMTWTNKHASKTDYYIFFVCIATYFAAINATKSPLGDQINYTWAYLNVPTHGFLSSLKNIYGYEVAMGGKGAANISGEFMNGIYNYLGYYLTFGYYPLFAALITFADYFLIFVGLYKYSLSLRKPHLPIVCGVLILSFFYLFFQYTLHIQKQFLAQSIMMYVLGNYAYSGKMTQKLWIITAISIFTHASMLLFVPFLVFKPLHSKLTKKGLLLIGTAFIALIILGPTLASNIVGDSNNSALMYGVNRFAKSETNNDTQTNVLVTSQIIVIYIPLLIIALRKLWIERKTLSDKNAFILNITLLLLLTIIGMYHQPLAQYRYFMILLAFMPFVYPFAFNKISKRDKLLKMIAAIMVVWFYYQFEKIVWTYAAEWEIIVKSPILLIAGNYYTY